MPETTNQTRRLFLRACAASIVTSVAAPALAALPRQSMRTVALENLHTGERLKVQYWADGRYLHDALSEVDHILRDFRTGEVHAIDPRLLDLLDALHGKLETTAPFQVISGYRSPKTNAMLHEASSGVAVRSLHMQGMAIDVRMPGRALKSVRAAALDLARGGVGYYPRSDFVHVDIGRVRHW